MRHELQAAGCSLLALALLQEHVKALSSTSVLQQVQQKHTALFALGLASRMRRSTPVSSLALLSTLCMIVQEQQMHYCCAASCMQPVWSTSLHCHLRVLCRSHSLDCSQLSFTHLWPAAQVQAAVDAKPEWHTVCATVTLVDPQQALYYCANPDNNKKVCA